MRNLREETRKELYGRLKQGLYPLRAPAGHLDRGGGKRKEIDPVAGPLIARALNSTRPPPNGVAIVSYFFVTLG
jgi:hypothetical protein